MRDGVRLAVDVYAGADPAPRPVVLHRTPYDRTATSDANVSQHDAVPLAPRDIGNFYWRHGFVYVTQDCRGRHASEGDFVKYVSDGTDGYDTCAWIVSQDWCDGRILTTGLSYDAHLQATLGLTDPPGLTGQIFDCGGLWNGWKSVIRTNGVYELKQATWAVAAARRSPEALADAAVAAALARETLAGWLRRLPWRPGQSPLKAHPRAEAALLEQWTEGEFSAYWQTPGLWFEGGHAQYPCVPCTHLSGWYDPYSVTAVGNFLGLSAAGRGPQTLILGAFTHGRRSERIVGCVDLGPEAPLDSWAGDWMQFQAHALRRALEGLPPDGPRVRYFMMGGGTGRRTDAGHLDHGGRWREATDWPPADAHPVNLHLQPDGRLGRTPPAHTAVMSFEFDPADPVPTVGGPLASLEPFASAGGFDQRTSAGPLAQRPDVLVFRTDLLETGVDLAGSVTLELTVSTDGPDTDFSGKLIDEYPPSTAYPEGFALNLCDSILRLRYVADPRRTEFPAPHSKVRVTLELPPMANHFAPGHRIRLDLSSSNFPRYDPNPNTGEPEGQALQQRVARNSIHMGADEVACMTLHVLKDPAEGGEIE
ncbi:CocE/NonD family hydrolase [Marinovum sp.]|uniref:CocE/NonD family hydrolase n=1 Tax=Marinovum sp. TaxID=2024839 RepID=UPI002B269ECA|nr:CocE/NonD family hydrolase [Marinovum sp.]